MSLSDPLYFAFLAAIFVLYYLFMPGLPRRILLLAASYFFYFELSKFYLLVLFFVTAATFFGARMLRSPMMGNRGLPLFGLSFGIILAPLIIFKYLGALLVEIGPGIPPVDALASHFTALALPVGISFFTFAALGYLIDVYLEIIEPETSFSRVALFLAFFPLISAGPIERAGRFMSQFDLAHTFSADRALAALRLIFLGLVLKLFFALNLMPPVDYVFSAPQNCLPLERLLGLVDYAFFLYSDFAGYSLIAIGSAKLFGLEVRPNFQQPFLSASIPEYWRNWHISLSSWVRDYIFLPLQMSWRRSPQVGLAAALLLSFIIIGVWHGAKWGYLVFGLLHAIYAISSNLTLARRNAFWKWIRLPEPLLYLQRVFATFALVLIAFVVFRADTLTDAMTIYRGIFSMELLRNLEQIFPWSGLRGQAPLTLNPLFNWTAWSLIALLILGDILARKKMTLEKFPLQVILYYIGFIIVLYQWTAGHVAEPFQYYKF
jgi:D-alanyl-lipoteichoic acid acyltransferase DltB (MBOAT superfamily)